MKVRQAELIHNFHYVGEHFDALTAELEVEPVKFRPIVIKKFLTAVKLLVVDILEALIRDDDFTSGLGESFSFEALY